MNKIKRTPFCKPFGLAHLGWSGVMIAVVTLNFFGTAHALDSMPMTLTRSNDVVESPDVAMSSNGQSVFVWQEKNDDGYDVFADVVDNRGYPLRLPFKVNQYAVSDQKFPRVAMDSKGNFVVVWQSYGQDGSAAGIYGQRFTPTGIKVGDEFKVHGDAVGNQMLPDVAMSASGFFAVTWVGNGKNEEGFSRTKIYAQWFDAKGKKIGKEFRAGDPSGLNETAPAIAVTPKNDVMIVWQSSDDKAVEIHGKIFNGTTAPLVKKEVLLSPKTEGSRIQPQVSALSPTQFMVVWSERIQDKKIKGIIFNKENIRGQLVNTQGALSGKPFDVNAPALSHQNDPHLAALPGNAVVVWGASVLDKGSGKLSWTILMQKLDTRGKTKGEPIHVTQSDGFSYDMPTVTSNSKGDIGVMWIRHNEAEKKNVIYFKRYLKKEATTTPNDSSPSLHSLQSYSEVPLFKKD